jgi:hypothetical protein
MQGSENDVVVISLTRSNTIGKVWNLDPKPETRNLQPSILNPQPSTLHPPPSTLNPQP